MLPNMNCIPFGSFSQKTGIDGDTFEGVPRALYLYYTLRDFPSPLARVEYIYILESDITFSSIWCVQACAPGALVRTICIFTFFPPREDSFVSRMCLT